MAVTTYEYKALLSRLFQVNRFSGVKLGLGNMRHLDAALGHPSRAYPVVHVAGSNGKGSVVTKVAAALQAEGYRVGKYTSPHLATFRERICVDDVMISEALVCDLLSKIFSVADKEQIPATFFELTTALAFTTFATEEIDVAVIETGLGGRLDATNIVNPIAAAITSIALEHCNILGNELEAIAKEKAGIIKSQIPVVLGPTVPQVVDTIAQERGSPCYRVGPSASIDAENAAISEELLNSIKDHFPVSDAATNEGLQSKPLCRQQRISYRNTNIILDVAHNLEGLRRLFDELALIHSGPWHLVLALSKGKDVDACLKIVDRFATTVHLPKMKHHRLLDACVLADQCHNSSILPTMEAAVESAINSAHSNKGSVIVCGSCFMMNEACRVLGRPLDSDDVDLNECN